MTNVFRALTGVEPAPFPVLAERLAVDLTSALRGAEAGLRALRGRPLLRRLWDGLVGPGLPAAVGGDLLAAQRATLALVREVMVEEGRTQSCVGRVLENLHAVNRDLDAAAARADAVALEVARLRADLRAETARLAAELEAVRGELRREAALRRMTELYRAGDLHRGTGELLEAALYLAAVGEDGLAVVKQRLPPRPLPLEDALLGAAHGPAPALVEPLLYLTRRPGPCLAVLAALAGRRLAGLPTGDRDAADAVAVVRATADPDRVLESRLVRPAELAASLAGELGS